MMFNYSKIYLVCDSKCGYYGNEVPFNIMAVSPIHALQCLGYIYINACIKEACNCIVTDEDGKEYYYHAYKY